MTGGDASPDRVLHRPPALEPPIPPLPSGLISSQPLTCSPKVEWRVFFDTPCIISRLYKYRDFRYYMISKFISKMSSKYSAVTRCCLKHSDITLTWLLNCRYVFCLLHPCCGMRTDRRIGNYDVLFLNLFAFSCIN